MAFESGDSHGWAPRADETVAVSTAAAHSGTGSLLASGRTRTWEGPTLDVLDTMDKGFRYTLSVWVRLAAGVGSTQARLSVERRTAGTPSYDQVVGNTNVSDSAWVNLRGQYTLGTDVEWLTVYVETASGTASLHLDDFTLSYTPATPIQTDIPSVKTVLAGHFPIGAAISLPQTLGEHARLLSKHFNSVTPGNALKWDGTDIATWDVVNEVIDENQSDGLRRSRWYEIAGLDYIRTAFRVTREVAPDAKLYDLVSQLKAEGVPLDVDQQATDMDVSICTSPSESFPTPPRERLIRQAYKYRDLFDVYKRYSSELTSVTVWGLADDDTWLDTFPWCATTPRCSSTSSCRRSRPTGASSTPPGSRRRRPPRLRPRRRWSRPRPRRPARRRPRPPHRHPVPARSRTGSWGTGRAASRVRCRSRRAGPWAAGPVATPRTARP